jgi:phage terminase small subunit
MGKLNRRFKKNGGNGRRTDHIQVDKESGLPIRQRLFLDYFFEEFNAKKAAIRAGYSKRSAEVIGFKLLRKKEVLAFGLKKLDDLQSKSNITQEGVFGEISKIGLSNIKDFVIWDRNGIRIKDSHELTRGQASCISEVKHTVTQNGGTISFKLYDKLKALELAGKYFKMFTEKVDVDVNVRGGVLVVPGTAKSTEAWIEQRAESQRLLNANNPIEPA